MTKKKAAVIGVIAAAFLLIIGVFGLGLLLGMRTGNMGAVDKVKDYISGRRPEDGIRITYEATEKKPSKRDMEDTIYKLQKRAELYSAEAEADQQGSRRIIVKIPDMEEEDADTVSEALIRQGSLEFITIHAGEVILTGSDVKDAKVMNQKSSTGEKEYVVQLILTEDGASKFAEATEKNIGRQIGIMFDEQQISAPVVQSKIIDGRPVITGMSGQEEAEELAAMIRIGALSLELEEVR